MGYGDGHSGGKLPRILGAILDRLHSPSKKHSEDRQEQYAPRLNYSEYHKSNQRQNVRRSDELSKYARLERSGPLENILCLEAFWNKVFSNISRKQIDNEYQLDTIEEHVEPERRSPILKFFKRVSGALNATQGEDRGFNKFQHSLGKSSKKVRYARSSTQNEKRSKSAGALPNRKKFGSIKGLTRSMPPIKPMRMRGAGSSSYKVSLPPDRVDVYYFDHGNARYLRTTDLSIATTTEVVAEQTERYATRFWAELFGTLHIGFAFLTTFILQLIRFLLFSGLRPLTVGVIQLVSDYCVKPLLTAIFNGMLQPPLIFLYNLANSFRDLCEPIADAIGHFFRPVADLFKSVRLVDMNGRNEPAAITETA